MRTLKAILSIASLALLGSCDINTFDDLEDSVWVHAAGNGNLSGGFGSAIVTAGSPEQLRYVILTELDPTALLVSFDAEGKREKKAPQPLNGIDPAIQALVAPIAVASDPAAFDSTGVGNVAIGVMTNSDPATPALVMLNGNDASLTGRIQLVGTAQPSGIVFGNTSAPADATDSEDLFAIAGAELNLIPDYQSAAEGSTSTSCSLAEGKGNLLIAEVDDSSAESELLVSVGNEVFVTSGSKIAAAISADEACFGTELPLGSITAPGGEASFGGLMQQADFDGNGQVDLVIAAPADNAVYVYMNWSVATPSSPLKIRNPGDAASFGAAIEVGDFNDDQKDELIVGDPNRQIADHAQAGSVYIYSSNMSGGFDAPIRLHDARAEDDQLFGRSLEVVRVSGRDKLVVGASNEVFTYFKTPVLGDQDLRPSQR